MRISAIQPSVYKTQLQSRMPQQKLREENPTQESQNQVSFKSEGGFLMGIGIGAMTAVGAALALGAAPILAPIVVIGGAAGGAAVADKIEEKLTGKKNKN